MAIVTKDNERLYLTSWEYNAAKILSRLAVIIQEKGGKVQPLHTALISNRNLSSAINKNKQTLENYMSAASSERIKTEIQRVTDKIKKLESINNEPISVTHTSYIKFILNGMIYYYELNDNPFFPFYYSKTKVIDNMFCLDIYAEEDPKKWIEEYHMTFECPDEKIETAANFIFNMLMNAKQSKAIKQGKKTRVPNQFDNGYHYEIISGPGRLKRVDF